MKKVLIAVLLMITSAFMVFNVNAYSVENDNAKMESYNVVTYYNDKSRTITTETHYNKYTYNLKDGEEHTTPAYIPKTLDNSQYSTKTVLWSDTRVQITNTTIHPYTYIGRIEFHWDTNGDGTVDTYTYGTGFLEGPDVLTTAGHAVYNASWGGFPSGIKYYPAIDEWTNQPFGYAGWSSITVSQNYVNNQSVDYDWAIIVLSSNVGASTGWFGKGWSSGSLNNKEISVTGYPGDKPSWTMWKGDGKITSTLTYRLRHNVDTYTGQSGAPMYDSNNIVWGIHTKGGNVFINNSGRKIDETLYNYLQEKCEEGMDRYYP
ncbi:MAG: trypsin-like serine protease [Tenericutes bacterium]|nr:trypsin-like serine protease [Mycoplasmatota bacterium]